MCGRFALIASAPRLARLLGLVKIPELTPRYNIAPSQPVAAIRNNPDGARQLVMLRWGLLPSWAKDPKPNYRMINAKAETLAQRPAFRVPFRRRRCLIAADGFYEWQRLEGRKQPYYITRRDREPFAFAGLWERWHGDDDEMVVESCTIITTPANETVAAIHDRMPAILDSAQFDLWLDSDSSPDKLQPLLEPYPADGLEALPVSSLVNNPRNDEPGCMRELEA